MVLTCDIGNSNLHLGIFDGARLVARHIVARPTFDPALLPEQPVNRAIIASVVPDALAGVVRALKERYHVAPHILEPGTPTGLKTRYLDPAQLGVDRIANMVGAWRTYGRDALVISFGTATTYDVVTRDGLHLGGTIAAGVTLALDALASRTAVLPRVEFAPAEQALGRSTADAIRSGSFFATRGSVFETVRQIEHELDLALFVLATGGLARVVAPFVPVIEEVNPDLSLIGLREILARLP